MYKRMGLAAAQSRRSGTLSRGSKTHSESSESPDSEIDPEPGPPGLAIEARVAPALSRGSDPLLVGSRISMDLSHPQPHPPRRWNAPVPLHAP